MFNKEYCDYVYDYFNKDFFQKELDCKLGKCTIFVNKKEDSKKVFTSLENTSVEDMPFGLSITLLGHNYIWINPLLLNNKKILVNTILHEMIHLYVNKIQPDIRRYRNGHGSLWTATAKYATAVYGEDLGDICQFATREEMKHYNHYQMIKSTKSLVNAYLVKLTSGDLVPIKDLTQHQINQLKEMDITGIYKVKPGVQQNTNTRVTRFIKWDKLLDCIENGIDAETEAVCSYLHFRIGVDTDMVWIRRGR